MSGQRRSVASKVAVLAVVLVVGGVAGYLVRAATSGLTVNGSVAAGVYDPALTKPVVDGHFTFTVLEFGCGLTGVQGTHSDAPPDGQFCHARLRIDNHDPDYHDYVSRSQYLAGVAKPRNHPDAFAMAVRRQPDRIRVGGHNAVEVEVWYDVPKDALVTGLRLSGDRDPVAFKSNQIIPHAAGGRYVEVTPTDESP